MKRNTRKLKQILVISILLLGLLTIGETKVRAALQANYATHTGETKKSGPVWIEEIRKMETAGQTMGLNETIDTATLLSSSESNGIDVHMMKSTEYGAVAILSVSGFGNSKKLSESSIKSSTGNVTGVYMGDRGEWTAGVFLDKTVGKDVRYYDLYIARKQTSAKVGDALGLDTYTTNPGCFGWHNGYKGFWESISGGGCIRGAGGIFDTRRDDYGWQNDSNVYCSRGVAVVGSNL